MSANFDEFPSLPFQDIKEKPKRISYIQSFHDLINYVYSHRSGADNPRRQNFYKTETSCHFGHLLQVLKKTLCSLILYIFFHDFIHVYTPRAGADNPLGTKF